MCLVRNSAHSRVSITVEPAVAVVRGAINQPEASRESAAGKQWDRERRQWVLMSDALAVDDPELRRQAQARRGNGGAGPSGDGKKMFPYYYQVLDVEVLPLLPLLPPPLPPLLSRRAARLGRAWRTWPHTGA